VSEGIGLLIAGKNPLWKQEVEMGKHQNQNSVQIPHARLIELLTYKAALVGIQVILTCDVNGSYTIGRKVAPTAFDGLGVGGVAVRPRRLAV
jgi:IS605 OrfB family transposase